VALVDAATLGTITQNPLHPATGYLSLFLVILYLMGVAALPSVRDVPEGSMVSSRDGRRLVRQ